MKLSQDFIFANRYQLKSILGRGGFSEVWLATDTLSNIDVAIKIYAPGNGMEDSGLEIFSHELSRVYNLQHTNLLKPQHVDVWENMPYLIMPFCRQGSCLKRIGKMSENEIWKLLKDVASGLEYLHERDFIHQDIKPDNILIDEEGNFLISDFGISTKARTTLRKSVQNVSGTGTMAYMAPERFSKNHEPIKASDIWALGATVYEIMEGHPPFDEMGGGFQKNGADIPDFTTNYSEKLKSLVIKMLALQPYDRPKASDIVNDDILEKEDATEPEISQQMGNTIERRKSKFWIILLFLLIPLFGFLYLKFFYHSLDVSEKRLSFSYKASSPEQIVYIKTTDDWWIADKPDWVIAEELFKGISLTVERNVDHYRIDTILIKTSYHECPIIISQDEGRPYSKILLKPDWVEKGLQLTSAEGYADITITTNAEQWSVKEIFTMSDVLNGKQSMFSSILVNGYEVDTVNSDGWWEETYNLRLNWYANLTDSTKTANIIIATNDDVEKIINIKQPPVDKSFSVSKIGKILFSKGNLQYQASTNTWRFAEHQYDVIGKGNEKISSSYSGWIDLFGYGTSGWDNGAIAYQPYSSSGNNFEYLEENLTGRYVNADWGVYNAISNGGNQAGLWRTLTAKEWQYLLLSRPRAEKLKSLGTIDGKKGLILLPDKWISPQNISFIPSATKWETNSYTIEQWTVLESYGAVFLPRSGYRGSTDYVDIEDGSYWTSTKCDDYYREDYKRWGNCLIFCDENNSYWLRALYDVSLHDRYDGLSVRLVRDCEMK